MTGLVPVSGTRGRKSATAPELAQRKTPPERGFSYKRLMRLELTTFCMASRRSSQLSYSRVDGGKYSRGFVELGARGILG